MLRRDIGLGIRLDYGTTSSLVVDRTPIFSHLKKIRKESLVWTTLWYDIRANYSQSQASKTYFGEQIARIVEGRKQNGENLCCHLYMPVGLAKRLERRDRDAPTDRR